VHGRTRPPQRRRRQRHLNGNAYLSPLTVSPTNVVRSPPCSVTKYVFGFIFAARTVNDVRDIIVVNTTYVTLRQNKWRPRSYAEETARRASTDSWHFGKSREIDCTRDDRAEYRLPFAWSYHAAPSTNFQWIVPVRRRLRRRTVANHFRADVNAPDCLWPGYVFQRVTWTTSTFRQRTPTHNVNVPDNSSYETRRRRRYLLISFAQKFMDQV